MAKFMFVYRDSSDADQADVSPEVMQQVIEQWMTWIQGAMEAGWMVEPGDALKGEGKVVRGDMVITDGPFAESKELVGGYSMVEAADLAAAAALAEGCPSLSVGGSVEVRELADIAPPE